MNGILEGVRVLELGGIGPGPFAAMVLGDLGASVCRVEAPTGAGLGADTLSRGKHVVRIDAKDPRGRDAIVELATRADVLIEGFRPGVAERLGLGPQELAAANGRLVYVRVTGFGQSGPLAHRAGHDITYLAHAGALGSIGASSAPPLPPLNLLADFGGGGMLAVVGALGGLLARERSGAGLVVDAAMVDGVLLTETMVLGMLARGQWRPQREVNLLDGGAPFYRTYACADGRWVAVGALEPGFFLELLDVLGLGGRFGLDDQVDEGRWGELRRALEEAFASAPRDVWVERFRGRDACVAPVLGLDELVHDEHLRARGAFVQVEGRFEPAPAPRFGGDPPRELPGPRRNPVAALVAAGLASARAEQLVAAGIVG